MISHFLFLSERVLGPLTLQWAHAEYPDDKLCETHVAARLVSAEGLPVSVFGSVGGAQPDRQEVTVKGEKASRRISEFSIDTISTGEAFAPTSDAEPDSRATSLKAQLDDMALLMEGKQSRLASPAEALRVQELIEGILRGASA